MADPTIGGSDTFPTTPNAVKIYLRETWDGAWFHSPDCEFRSARLASAGHGQSSAEFFRRYGLIRQPYDTAIQKIDRTLDINNGYWVKVALIDDDAETPAFVGRVQNIRTELGGNAPSHGSDVNVPTGRQHFTAYGGLEYLDKIDLYQSWWRVRHSNGVTSVTQAKLLDWIPPINQRDRLGVLSGNRSDELSDDEGYEPTYLYGGNEVWTYRQYLDYILARFVNCLEGPQFELDGMVEFLDDAEQLVRLDKSIFRGLQRGSLNPGQTISVGQLLRTLINPQLGLDFVVRPDFDESSGGDVTFKVHVFALVPDDSEFDSVTLPKNDFYVDVDPSEDVNRLLGAPEIIESNEHRYDKIVVLGERIVTMVTLRANESDEENRKSLVAGWTQALADEYKAPSVAVGGTDAGDYDRYRRLEQFRNVFATFVAPPHWNLNNGKASVKLSPFGAAGQPDDTTIAQFQTAVRETLCWLPLFAEADYTVSPIVSHAVTDSQPELLPPIVLIKNEDTGCYELIENYQISVHALRNDWGVFLNPNPGHRLALRHWDGTGEVGSDNRVAASLTNHDPEFDWSTLIVTLAFPSDTRLRVEHTLNSSEPLKDQAVKTIEVPGAELWYAADRTIVGLNALGQPVQLHDSNRLLRSDVDKLRATMAGAIARYAAERRRCRIQIAEIAKMQETIGMMLRQFKTTIGENSDVVDINAPITCCEWSDGGGGATRKTTIFAGLTL